MIDLDEILSDISVPDLSCPLDLKQIESSPQGKDIFAEQKRHAWDHSIEARCDKSLQKGDWCIVTTPKRRHLVRNFATSISLRIAELLAIPFYEDVAFCHSKQRLGAVFTLNVLPKEQNCIVFDDFVTTGSTLKAMKNLLEGEHHKNCVFFTGINNKL